MAAEDLIRELERRPDLAKKLAELLAPHIAGYITVPLNVATKDDVKRLEEKMATKEDLKQYATKEDLKNEVRRLEGEIGDLRGEVDRLSRKVDAIGARWGVFSEDAFRRGIREFLEQVGYRVERWEYYDKDGVVFGFPSMVDLDVVIRDNKVFIVKIKSAASRGDLGSFVKKAELYEKVTGIKASGKYLITYYINDKDPEGLMRTAEGFGVRVISPEEFASQ